MKILHQVEIKMRSRTTNAQKIWFKDLAGGFWGNFCVYALIVPLVKRVITWSLDVIFFLWNYCSFYFFFRTYTTFIRILYYLSIAMINIKFSIFWAYLLEIENEHANDSYDRASQSEREKRRSKKKTFLYYIERMMKQKAREKISKNFAERFFKNNNNKNVEEKRERERIKILSSEMYAGRFLFLLVLKNTKKMSKKSFLVRFSEKKK